MNFSIREFAVGGPYEPPVADVSGLIRLGFAVGVLVGVSLGVWFTFLAIGGGS